MAVSSIRVRPSRRSRGRNESGEEAVPLDLNRDPAENLHEILQNVVKQKEVSNMRKLGHLNNFVKLLCSVGHSEEKLGFTHEEIIICLRLALLNEVKEVRAAGLRALRYLIRDSSVLEKVLRLQVDYLIARCIDIQQSNEVERTQAVRLARKMISVNARLFPSSLANSLIAVGNDGLHERDRMVRACVAIICELSLKNPVVVAQRGGLSTILRSVTACQLIRINEALITTVLHLLNHPHTRRYVRADVELEQILAPYTDFHYRHSPDSGHLKEDRQAQFTASKMSIVASFRSWSGIINLCKSGSSGLQSLIGLLCIPNMEVRKALLEVFYEIFHLVKPAVTADFNQALRSVDPSRFQDSWRLSDGFVASEAKTVLPHRSCSRVDLMDNYLALVLSAFIHSGLLEGLIEVITSSDEVLSVCATVLLGELLHMANTILPHSHSHHLHCLPSLINMAASFDITPEKRLRASAAVNHLKSFHEKKKKGVTPESLYLDHILRTSGSSHCCRDQHVKPQRDIFVIKDSEDALTAHLRDSHILNHKDHLDWNWCLIGTILKWPNISLRSHKDEQMHKFVQRLLFFYKPSSQQYGSLEAEHPKARQLTVVGCQFVDFLLISEEDGQAYLEDLVRDIAQCLFSAQFNPERLSGGWLLSTLSQHYFLFLGSLSAHTHGVRMLERCSVFQSLLSMCSLKNQEHLLKLTVSTLDYSRDGLSRVILSKVLTAANDTCRLYATKHLRVLLRAGVEFFSNWGVELLVTQLYDRNKTVSMEALDILDEACEDKTNLHALIDMRPALSHLGDKGVLLLIRFLSIPKGFSYLSERGYVSAEMERWQKEFNLKYVELIEEQLNEALTTYRKPVNGDEYVRRSNQRSQRPHVYLPVHLYGQLVHDKTGCQLLQAQNVVPDLSLTVRSPVLDRWEGIKQLKAALWALGHIGSSTWGLNLLQDEGVIPDLVDLAHSCEVLSIRGTCLYILGLLSRTRRGCDLLKQQGWDSVRHGRRTRWPVVPEELEPQSRTLSVCVLDADRLQSSDQSEDSSPYTCPKLMKDQTPITVLAPCSLRSRLLHSLSLPRKKLSSPDQPEDSSPDQPEDSGADPGGEPEGGRGLKDSEEEFSFYNKKQLSPGGEENRGSSPILGEREVNGTGEVNGLGENQKRAACSYERLAEDGPSGGGGVPFKSRSQSFNTDTTTSGISSMSSSPTREALHPPSETRKTPPPCSTPLSIPKSCSAFLVPPGSAHTLPRRAPSFRSPSVSTLSSLADCGLFCSSSSCCTSPRDALGYTTLRRLQHQRIQPCVSHSEARASPAKEILFTDTITMKSGSLDSRRTAQRFLKALSFACLDKEDLLSPINQNFLQSSPSVRSVVSSGSYSSSEEFMGLALPVNINNMLHIKDTPYFQTTMSPPSEECSAGFFSAQSDGLSDEGRPSRLRPQLSVTELLTVSRTNQKPMDDSEDGGLQDHEQNTCLYCSGLTVGGARCEDRDQELTDAPLCSERLSLAPSQLEVLVQSELSGGSGCSDTVSQGSAGSGQSSEMVLGVKAITEDAPAGRVLLRKEVLRLIINLSSSVGTKNHETSLLTIKEKFPSAFDDVCLYSEVSFLLARCSFRLTSRRFIQELFQDVPFTPLYEEAETVLSMLPRRPSAPPTDC
ncbi:rapamycin-insensitive companion of mTOR-like isoform X2 [Cheilinus undulatus]|uniref:rapamycin-insensitive companion of mTOR-like isoform X2 n=1 Tax=Cheilinus undulatus TaxID=241271 RepID=UPI001BD416D5|nr:rapamycin-insensitive companion of mTOR-like isoform X2 [Cheilinus undulatus]